MSNEVNPFDALLSACSRDGLGSLFRGRWLLSLRHGIWGFPFPPIPLQPVRSCLLCLLVLCVLRSCLQFTNNIRKNKTSRRNGKSLSNHHENTFLMPDSPVYAAPASLSFLAVLPAFRLPCSHCASAIYRPMPYHNRTHQPADL